jgi:hypothetical protein
MTPKAQIFLQNKQEDLGRNNRGLFFRTTWTSQKTKNIGGTQASFYVFEVRKVS